MSKINGLHISEKRAEDFKKKYSIRKAITVFGTSVADLEELRKFCVSADLMSMLITKLSESKVALLNGGYKGTMSGLAKEVIDRGGLALGFASKTIDDPLENQLYSNLLVLENHWDRLAFLIECADSLVFLPGGIGTLTEIMASLWVIDRKLCREKPLIFLGMYWKPIIDSFFSLPMMFRSKRDSGLTFIENPENLEMALTSL